MGEPAQAVCPPFQEDVFRRQQHPLDRQVGVHAPEGQHIELGIAEMNLFLLLGAAGLSHSLFGKAAHSRSARSMTRSWPAASMR
jgi:hypothetical protein